MHILVNGAAHDVCATTLAQALDALGYRRAIVATALNGAFVPTDHRDTTALAEGDALEILAPMQGG
ncbi:thiamine biosynthesis protein ThiS [Rhodanobacter fulvus Jip2]|uniref:Thiamine biosynthesis protein ThiS n=1 Tax=Rhodanobacter fulvus Jip2 TaxID=1163408 RepID=I4VQ27_9GAMM|nr:sulfur carrier protein ThiS [Rhodanobacter fulvus]EIL89318.1 thiamine biosynthesis protein ThiS [Rhodanobacter fulvus Jip2]